MGLLRLGVCVGGVYAMFLLWAVAQERLSVPFSNRDGTSSDRFKSSMVMSTAQSLLSSLSSLLYIFLRRKSGETLKVALGLEVKPDEAVKLEKIGRGKGKLQNGTSNGHAASNANGHVRQRQQLDASQRQKGIMLRYFQCSLFVVLAAPLGFAALSHISYPAMVLGKSCKLVPVMIMNVLLYRRKFAPHKYLVVAMVTAGITMFMFFGTEGERPKHSKGKELSSTTDSLIGVLYLLVNLAIDGLINSTQDEIFARYRVTGQQMMFWMNIMCSCITATLISLPLPYIPVLHPSHVGRSDLALAREFMREHPGFVLPFIQFSMTGALGQLFIFETLQHFGSLTLVTITLTRKMFTMILSVVVYNHKLTIGQWFGAGVVFAGITVEAWVKRKDVHAKRVIEEKEKAKLKAL